MIERMRVRKIEKKHLAYLLLALSRVFEFQLSNSTQLLWVKQMREWSLIFVRGGFSHSLYLTILLTHFLFLLNFFFLNVSIFPQLVLISFISLFLSCSFHILYCLSLFFLSHPLFLIQPLYLFSLSYF